MPGLEDNPQEDEKNPHDFLSDHLCMKQCMTIHKYRESQCFTRTSNDHIYIIVDALPQSGTGTLRIIQATIGHQCREPRLGSVHIPTHSACAEQTFGQGRKACKEIIQIIFQQHL